jgi:hypothetical protein
MGSPPHPYPHSIVAVVPDRRSSSGSASTTQQSASPQSAASAPAAAAASAASSGGGGSSNGSGRPGACVLLAASGSGAELLQQRPVMRGPEWSGARLAAAPAGALALRVPPEGAASQVRWGWLCRARTPAVMMGWTGMDCVVSWGRQPD